MDENQERRLLEKLERLTKSTSTTTEFVAEELQKLYERELSNVSLKDATPEQKGRVLTIIKKIGDVNLMVRKLEKAMEYYDQVLQAGPDTPQAAAVNQSLGDLKRHSGDWDNAMAHFEKAIAIGKRVGDKVGLAEAMRGLGYVFWRKGRYEKAMDNFEGAIQLLQEGTTDTRTSKEANERLGVALIEVANVWAERGFSDKALGYYERSLKTLMKERNHEQISRVHNNIGHTLLNMSRIDASLKEFEAAAKSARLAKAPRMLAWSLLNLAEVNARAGDTKLARQQYEEAEQNLMKVDDGVANARLRYIQGYLYLAEGDHEKARKYFEESIKMVEALETPHIIAYYTYNFAKALDLMGNRRRARVLLNKSLKTFKNIKADGFAEQVEQTLKGMGR